MPTILTDNAGNCAQVLPDGALKVVIVGDYREKNMDGALLSLGHLLPQVDLRPGTVAGSIEQIIQNLNTRIQTLEERLREFENKKDEPHPAMNSSFVLKI
jgi:hypothetical protein